MGTIGQVKRTPATMCEFEWSIPEFASLATEGFWRYRSPPFDALGESCYLCIYLNNFQSSTPSTTQNDTLEYFDIGFNISTSKTPTTVPEVSFAIKNSDGNKVQERHNPCQMISPKSLQYEDNGYIFRAELLERASELMPSNILTVFCTVRNPKSMDGRSKGEISKCTFCKGIVDAKAISFHEKNCSKKPMKCPECSEVVSLRRWSFHGCQPTKKTGGVATAQCSHCKEILDSESMPSRKKRRIDKPRSLIEDYKKVLLDGRNHDLVLKMGDVELRAHRDILRARSHVFQSMLENDMKEKEGSVVDVHDCDPQAMELFLSYIYTGKVEGLDQSNMLRLYYIADKYDMHDLKESCCEFIKKSLSISNICDVIQMSLSHSNTGLLEYATEYFMHNTPEIIVTVEWQSFLMNNRTVGNELLLKSFQKVKN